MQIICPNCSAHYTLAPQQIAAPGITVECSKCKHKWFQTPPNSDKDARLGGAPLPPDNPQTQDTVDSDLAKEYTSQRKRNTKFGLLAMLIIVIAFGGWYGYSLLPEAPKEEVAEEVGEDEIPQDPTTFAQLKIDNIEKSFKEQGSNTLLMFTGVVTNTGGVPLKIPPITVALFDESETMIDQWPAQLQREMIEGGESTSWVCRFFDPDMEKIKDFKVGFGNFKK